MEFETIEKCEDVEILDKDGNVLYTNSTKNKYNAKYSSFDSDLHRKSFLGKILTPIKLLVVSIFNIMRFLLSNIFVIIVGGASLILGIVAILISTFISIVFVLFNKAFKRK